MDAIILAGGKGTRLSKVVKDIPKPMASLDDGRPFVDVIVKRLKSQGISRIIMATGYLADHIHDFYKNDSHLLCIREDRPMGTGGAVLNVMNTLQDLSDPFFVLNGDSYYPFELSDFNAHETSSIGVVNMNDCARYGIVVLDKNDLVTQFVEKTGLGQSGFVSAGVYCLYKKDIMPFDLKHCSIETDIFPILVAKKHLKAVKNKGPMLDIGLPETYGIASQFIKDLGA